MTSRILSDLERSIRASSDEREIALLRAERALHLARRGGESQSNARQEIDVLRKINLSWGSPELSAWCHLAEGMLQLTVGNYARAADSIERARAVAASVSDRRSQSWAVTLQAFLAYVRGDIDDVNEKVRRVLDWIVDADSLAVARAKMLVGQILHYAGRYESARQWYAESRSLAMSRGDDGFASALLFNVASHHVCSLRHQYFRGANIHELARLVSLAVDSVKNYDDHARISSQSSFSSTLQASIYIFMEKFEEAEVLLRSSEDKADEEGLSKMKSIYLADLAYCRLKMGMIEDAVAVAAPAENAISDVEHPENAAYTRDRLAELYSDLGYTERSISLHDVATSDWRRYEHEQGLAVDSLRRWKII